MSVDPAIWSRRQPPAYEIKNGGYLLSIGGRPVTRRPAPARPTPRPAPATRTAARPVDRGELAAIGRHLEWVDLRAENTEREQRLAEPARYVITPGIRVDRQGRRAAERVAELCAEDLGIRKRVVVWFQPATPLALAKAGPSAAALTFNGSDGLTGRYDHSQPGLVLIRAGRDLLVTIQTVAHEIRHAAQGRPRDVAESARFDQEAQDYATRVVAWFEAQGGKTW